MARSKPVKILRSIFIIFLGVLIGLIVSFYFSLRSSLPKTEGSLPVNGISHQVEITYDSMGIAQIWAETDQDLYFALGYQHCADRMFQMDLIRHTVKGELSSLFGKDLLGLDKKMRKMGHYRKANIFKESLCPYSADLLQKYCDGINSYAKSAGSLPFEYYFLPLDFEDFTIEDIMAIFNFQTWYSNALMNNDSTYLELFDKLGEEKIHSLYFPYPDWAPVTVGANDLSQEKTGIEYNQLPFIYEPQSHKMSFASNAWVVSGDKTKSGKPILASDPHLILNRLPQFWYAVGLHSKESDIDVYGITVPGIPFVVMGHNINSAYAFTAGGNDINSFYKLPDSNQIETINITDTFHVVGEDEPIYLTYQITDDGSLLSTNEETSETLIYRWSGFDNKLDAMMMNGFRLHQVKSFEQFQKIVTGFGSLDANMVYADTQNNIGYQLTTNLPERENYLDYLPKDYSQSWKNYYPMELTPQIKNPAKGWIASANNKPDNNHYATGNYYASRILSIDLLLQSKESFEIDDMKRFQLDIKDRYLLRFTKEIADILDSLQLPNRATEIRNWNGLCTISSSETALIVAYIDELKKVIFEDELESIFRSIPGKYIENLDSLESAGWFDNINTPEIETRIATSKKAMISALELTKDKTWGDMQTFKMEHPFSQIPILDGLLGLSKDIGQRSGTKGTLNASFTTRNSYGEYNIIVGPSSRFIIDLANPDSVQMVLPFGNSGNPMSDHFDDFYELWSEGKYWTVPITYEKVKARAKSILTLEPYNN